ncbi:alpha/beta hydrolase [Echinimonas agarilytica]|uniref:Alpha/beta hydrolase-fold protein n=1 Tax=Echinimonas agarilytica TaxID=1215918 RepID=A0AA41W688_9GAMM|nr:alpha/beta hydrolase-fold protein [Echinimonas agarilytica]MCM2679506.1 alpha/beta hydrolase-fold protein [Echinimonas agarilytica]
MTICRLEVSNPAFTPDNTQFVTVHSSHLNRRHDVSIYNVNAQTENVPIIVLMHGVYGNHWVWMGLGGIHHVYERLRSEHKISEFVLVMPSDGGLRDGSAYLPTKGHGNYEQWIMDDVITAVQKTVENVTINSPLYLSGLSMGGYGALRLGAKYAEQVSGISAHSSITDLLELTEFVDHSLDAYDCRNLHESNIVYWMNKNKNKLPPIRFDCGREDILYSGNIRFVEELKSNGIPHIYETFEGEHSWEYWHTHIVQTFEFFSDIQTHRR